MLGRAYKERLTSAFLAMGLVMLTVGLVAGRQLVEQGARLFSSANETSTTGGTYFVSPTGNDSASGAASSPWKTISKANATLKAGETVVLMSGTYTSQFIRPANSGTPQARITYKSAPGSTVIIESSSTLINLADKSYITVEGPITFRNPGSEWAVIRNGTQNIISNSTFIGNGKKSYSGMYIGTSATHTKIIGNTFRDWGVFDSSQWGDALRIEGSLYSLVEGNRFINAGHSLIDLNSSHNIIRGNYFENNWQKSLDVVWRSVATEHNVIEYNIFKKSRPASNGSNGGIGLQLASPKNIIRHNVFLDSSFAGIELNAFTESPNASGNRIYHNTFINNGFTSGSLRAGFTATNWGTASWNVGNTALKNNIFSRNNNNNVQIMLDMGGSSFGASYYNSSYQLSGNCFSQQPDITISGLDRRQSITTYQQKYAFISDNEIGTPQFENEQADNYLLKSGSLCSGKAVALTTVRSNGSGTALPVQDALYFSDGKGLVAGDQIRVGSNSASIVAVNYGTNTLTLDKSLSWTAGEGVFVASGNDMGIHLLGQTSMPTPEPTLVATHTPVPTATVMPSSTPTPRPTNTPTPRPTNTPQPTSTPVSAPTAPQSVSKLSVVGVSASSHDGNVPQNTLDGNLSTRWSAYGDGQWIRYDLGSVKTVTHLMIAFHRATMQIAQFDIELSTDGSSWNKVFAGQSSPTTLDLQRFDFTQSQARYVRIVGHGNLTTTDTWWNSLSEVEIHGVQSDTYVPVATNTPSPSPTNTPVPTSTTDNIAPRVTITSPSDGGTVRRGKRFTLQATATDNVRVKEVTFFINGSRLCVDSTVAYTCNWSVPRTAGASYIVEAQAVDTSGNIGMHRIRVTAR